MKYKNYLKSTDWQNKRGTKLNRKLGSKKRCAICASEKNLHIHHLSYRDDLSETEQKDLRVLCNNCHFLTHELFKKGKIKFRSINHNSRFAIIKSAVKKHLKISTKNLFAEAV